jgi:hypothetical protein
MGGIEVPTLAQNVVLDVNIGCLIMRSCVQCVGQDRTDIHFRAKILQVMVAVFNSGGDTCSQPSMYERPGPFVLCTMTLRKRQ